MRMPTVGAGFHARPASVNGRRRRARMKRCAGCARGIEYVGRWTPPSAPWKTPSQSATPTIRNQPTPAMPRPRGVEDAAPYGRQLNVGISIVVNRCAIAANLRPSLGSPFRGAEGWAEVVTFSHLLPTMLIPTFICYP